MAFCWIIVHMGEAGTPETRTLERPDRYVVSHSWFQLFSEAFIEHLVRYKSDHVAMFERELELLEHVVAGLEGSDLKP